MAAQPGTVWWPPALGHLGDVERARLEKLSPMKRNRNSPPSPCPPSAGVGVVLCFFFLLSVMGKICGCSLASKAGGRGLLPGCAPCSSRHKRTQIRGCRACAEASGSGTAAFQLLGIPAFPSLPRRAIRGTP